jgi:hypothetical protein
MCIDFNTQKPESPKRSMDWTQAMYLTWKQLQQEDLRKLAIKKGIGDGEEELYLGFGERLRKGSS